MLLEVHQVQYGAAQQVETLHHCERVRARKLSMPREPTSLKFCMRVQPVDRRPERQPGLTGTQRSHRPRHSPSRPQRPQPQLPGQPRPQRGRARAPSQRHAGPRPATASSATEACAVQQGCSSAIYLMQRSKGWCPTDPEWRLLFPRLIGKDKTELSSGVQVDGEGGRMPYGASMGSDTLHKGLAHLREDVPMNFDMVGPYCTPVLVSLCACTLYRCLFSDQWLLFHIYLFLLIPRGVLKTLEGAPIPSHCQITANQAWVRGNYGLFVQMPGRDA